MGFDKNVDLEQIKHYHWRNSLFHSYKQIVWDIFLQNI